MFPFIITWATDNLKEIFKDITYNNVDELKQIDKIIYEFIDKIILIYDIKIKNEIRNYGICKPKQFYEIVNSQHYNDTIFFSIKYFDTIGKTWKDYKINEAKLNKYLISHLTLIK
jgi:hypothetical protein